MSTTDRRERGGIRRALGVLGLVLSLLSESAPQSAPPWQELVRARVAAQQLDSALAVVDGQLAARPEDAEAHGWRGRLLAWKGQWLEAESEYRIVLMRAPDDAEILAGLADVLLWQGRSREALAAANQACKLAPGDVEVLARRARILRALGDEAGAREQYREILVRDPQNAEAQNKLRATPRERRNTLSVGTNVDTFNFTSAAHDEGVVLASRWTPRWATAFGVSSYERFGENATKFTGNGSLRFLGNNWITLGGAAADDNGVIPKGEAFFEYGRGLRLGNRWIRGLEASYQQRWLWYRGAHVLTVGVTQLYYLPHEWTWALAVTGARSGFTGADVAWAPAGSTRLAFPLHRRLSGGLAFAAGTENFAQIDQIGRFSARTYAGDLKLQLTTNQYLRGSIAVQDRTQGRTQNSYGLSYELHF